MVLPGTPLATIDMGAALDVGDGVVTVSFVQDGSARQYYSDGTVYDFVTIDWTDYEIEQAMAALATYETFLPIEFRRIDDEEAADFVLFKSSEVAPVFAWMYFPGGPNAGLSGYSPAVFEPKHGQLVPGSDSFYTLIHEFGHGLGLDHPFDGIRSEVLPGSTDYPTDGPASGLAGLNQGVFTVMSYQGGWPDGPIAHDDLTYGMARTPMALDIAVLQAKYGANMDHATGDDIYDLPTANGPGTGYAAIWDAGGRDTIRAKGPSAATIDLRPATLQYEPGGGGYISYIAGIVGGFTIAAGVVIEDAIGGNGKDTLIGNDAGNRLVGGRGNDLLLGFEGADKLVGGRGDDAVHGGKGDDVLIEVGGRNAMDGEAGDDRIFGGFDDDTIFGGPGNDRIAGRGGDDEISGGSGNDRLVAVSGWNVMDGGDGDDTLRGGRDGDELSGGAGNDRIVAISGWNVMDGGDGDDTLRGGRDGDNFSGGAGNDRLVAVSGWNNMDGGDGDDTLRGGRDGDHLSGGAGNDLIKGGGGSDWLEGGAGDDTLAAGRSDVFAFGGTGSDRLVGGALDDRLEGGVGTDTVTGGAGRDRLAGGPGKDRLHGGDDGDRLLGGTGHDRLFGGSGCDFIIGGRGKDTMTGGSDRDVFVVKRSGGVDIVRDFTPGEDLVDVTAFRFADEDEVLELASERPAGTAITFDEDATLLLRGVSPADLSPSDFLI